MISWLLRLRSPIEVLCWPAVLQYYSPLSANVHPVALNESIIWGWHFCVSLGELSTYSVKEAQYMTFASTRTRQTFPSTILCSYTYCSFSAIRHLTFINLIHPNKQISLSNTNHGFLTLLVRREINRVRFGAHDIGTRKLVRMNKGILLVGLSSGFCLAEISSSCSLLKIACQIGTQSVCLILTCWSHPSSPPSEINRMEGVPPKRDKRH